MMDTLFLLQELQERTLALFERIRQLYRSVSPTGTVDDITLRQLEIIAEELAWVERLMSDVVSDLQQQEDA